MSKVELTGRAKRYILTHMFERLALGLENPGRPGDKIAANTVRSLREHRNKDILLSSDQASSISPELQEALKHEGLTAIYDLNGSTIAQQKAEGSKFWYITPADNNGVLRVPSLVGAVAFDPRPNKFFLPKSDRLTLAEQLEMTAEYSDKLQRKLGTKEIMAVLHEAPTYSAIAFAHIGRTGQRLFGENYGFNYTRTVTGLGGSGVAIVGRFDAGHGLHVHDWDRVDRYYCVWAAPLVVPSVAVGR